MSAVNIVEAWNKCMETFNPIQIYWNDEIIWNGFRTWRMGKSKSSIYAMGGLSSKL